MNNPTMFNTELGRLSLSEFLRQTSPAWLMSTATNSSGATNTINWQKTPKIVPEKELTEKQLFTKLKKELKEVTVKLN